MIRELADRLGAPVSFIFLVSGWLSHKATLDQVTALAREVIPNLFGAFKGMEESMRLTSEEASRQMKRRSALR
jgi:limonene 1,2-monooxygenase